MDREFGFRLVCGIGIIWHGGHMASEPVSRRQEDTPAEMVAIESAPPQTINDGIFLKQSSDSATLTDAAVRMIPPSGYEVT